MPKGYTRTVYLVDGARTPFLKAKGPGVFSASDLAVGVGKSLLARQPFMPSAIEEVIMGCVMPSPNEANIARLIALRLGCEESTTAWTVQRNCASGMQAIDCAAKDIACGRHDLVLAGGVEAMSRAPVLYPDAYVSWLMNYMSAKTVSNRLRSLLGFQGKFLKPIFGLQCGLTDPLVQMNMGQTAEQLAHDFNITRAQMDDYSVRSHDLASASRSISEQSEILPLYDEDGKLYLEDEGIREGSSIESLAKLTPIFDKRYGRVTAGNSSQVTDGAAMLILASAKAVKKYQLPVLATIKDCHWSGLSPKVMGLGPAYSVPALLAKHQLTLKDIDLMELNEAFSGQVLACLKAWQDEDFCQKQLGLASAFGQCNLNRLNVEGGAIALGHPVGASGARIVLHLAKLLNRQKKQRGIATLCIGGGQGGSVLIERS